ncbi:MAG: PFL family protein [Candidatus Sumerlaeia bacterium]|nr:PFL family protein [Candidatus Sumerlaeia bacterium]
MLQCQSILDTLEMIQKEHLDVRCVTMGINLFDCICPEAEYLCRRVRDKIVSKASRLVRECERVSRKYGIPVVNRRIAITPAGFLLAGHGRETALSLGRTLDEACREVGVDLLGGFSAFVQKGMTAGEETLIRSLPAVLSQTRRLCASINVASSTAGINVDAVLLMGEIIRQTAEATAAQDGFGCAKLVVFANIPEDNPFMAGALCGPGEPECVINIGVSGPGVIKRALERLLAERPNATFQQIAERIKETAFRVTRVGELIGREVSTALGVSFGIVDLSLAPTPQVGDSVGEILQVLGLEKIGAPGSTAAIALLNDAVKKGGLFASSSVGGLSGAFIPVSEDAMLAAAAAAGDLTLEKLEAMTSVCSVGLDMIVIPGDTDAATIAALIADEMAIGVINKKTTAVRVIPAPGKKVGDTVSWGGLFGSAPVMAVRNSGTSAAFIRHGGRIPAPLQSLTN